MTPKQGSLNATLTTYCSPICTEAQCNQSNPKKWKVSLGRCSRPLIWSDSHILDKHTCHCPSHITFSDSKTEDRRGVQICVCVCLHVCIYAEVSMRTHKKVSSSLFFSFLWVDMSTRLQLLYRNTARFFHWLLQPMFMKQDIWDIYFETGVRMDLMCQNLLTITLRV